MSKWIWKENEPERYIFYRVGQYYKKSYGSACPFCGDSYVCRTALVNHVQKKHKSICFTDLQWDILRAIRELTVKYPLGVSIYEITTKLITYGWRAVRRSELTKQVWGAVRQLVKRRILDYKYYDCLLLFKVRERWD